MLSISLRGVACVGARGVARSGLRSPDRESLCSWRAAEQQSRRPRRAPRAAKPPKQAAQFWPVPASDVGAAYTAYRRLEALYEIACNEVRKRQRGRDPPRRRSSPSAIGQLLLCPIEDSSTSCPIAATRCQLFHGSPDRTCVADGKASEQASVSMTELAPRRP